MLADNVTLFKVVVVPATASIAPPARLEMLPVKLDDEAINVAPDPTIIAPPLPLAPFALLEEINELLMKRLAVVTCIAPPLSAKPFVRVSMFTVKSPVVTLKILPLALPSTMVFEIPFPVNVSVLSIVICPIVSITALTLGSKVIVAPALAEAI